MTIVILTQMNSPAIEAPTRINPNSNRGRRKPILIPLNPNQIKLDAP